MLLGVQRTHVAFGEQVDVADHDVERRAQLMRHGADELRLQATGSAQALDQARVLQRDRRLLRDTPKQALLARREGPGALIESGSEHARPRRRHAAGRRTERGHLPALQQRGRKESGATILDRNDSVLRHGREQRRAGDGKLEAAHLLQHLTVGSRHRRDAVDVAWFVVQQGHAPLAPQGLPDDLVQALEDLVRFQ